jgi:hypothetical protein
MSVIYVLEWTFSPSDYFEQPIVINREKFQMQIMGGKIIAKVNEKNFEEDQSLREKIHTSVNDRFLGVQFLTHKPYELSKPSLYKLHPDGRKDYFIQVESAVVVSDVGSTDILITDKNGKIIADTRKDRIEKKKSIAELVEKHKCVNPILDSILTSYHNAVKDPDNELVHLYEIRESMVITFGDENVTRNKLGISKNEWSEFGDLANNAPLKQGRHRGKHLGVLHDATNDELNKARTFAQKIIIRFIDLLERQS